MKDSDLKSKKSSSDSENLVSNKIPDMPKDKRTKAYKEWVKKYGQQASDSNETPDMPKDKRTKAYKEWIKKYGDQSIPSIKPNKPSKKDPKNKKENLSIHELATSFIELIDSNEWFNKRKEIEEIRSKINSVVKSTKTDTEESKKAKSLFFNSLKTYSFKKKKYFKELNSHQILQTVFSDE